MTPPQSTIFFLIIIALTLCLLPVLAAIGTLFTTRQGKSQTVATVYEAVIRSITAKLFLWCIYYYAPSVGSTFRGFETELPMLTELTLRFSGGIRQVTGTLWQFVVLLFFCTAVVAMIVAVFHQLGSNGLNHSRKFSLLVSAVTFFGVGLMAIPLILPCIKLLNDFS